MSEAEIRNIIAGSIEAGRRCMERGNEDAARAHFETADAFASDLSLKSIRAGRGI